MTGSPRRRGRQQRDTEPIEEANEDVMPAITVQTQAGLDRMWAVQVAETAAADAAKEAAKDAQRIGNQFQAEANTLQQQADAKLEEADRRAREILEQGNQSAAEFRSQAAEKTALAQQALNRSAGAARAEQAHRDVASDHEATVETQAALNSNLTHPRDRIPAHPALSQVSSLPPGVEAFEADPLNAPMPDPNGTPHDGVPMGAPRLASDLPGVRVAPNDPRTQAMPASPPTEQVS